ncbi:FAD-dependent monooxygenase [Streptomyces sp. NPDC050738]|uniref:FAD-dependent monooxygenase n=1 Tax=Streptomyces sp. NPDC050738 TaxID=3154744 RepID=UPI003414F50E
MSTPTPVMIVGAGPVGLTLGSELLQRGIPVRLIEQAERPRPHAKAVLLWPRGIEALGRIGVAEEIVERGHALQAQNYHSGARRLARTRFDGLSGTRYPYALSLSQEETEAVLRERFESLGGRIDFGVRLESLKQTSHGAEAELSALGATWSETCSWVVGCDGAHSTVRESLGVALTGESRPQQFLLADSACETTLAQDEAHYFMTPSGALAVVGLPGGLYRICVSVPPDTRIDDALRLVREAAAERCPVPLELVGEPRTGVFRVHRRAAERFRIGKVMLAGDAAHIHGPAGGQGLNTGLEDASSLGWRLAQVIAGDSGAGVLDDWERERQHVAQGVVDDTDLQTRLWTLKGWRRALRDALIRVAQATGVLERFVVPRQAQLTLGYPGSRQRHGAVRAGHRLPDIQLSGGHWLHRLLDPERPTLLLLASSSSVAAHQLSLEWAKEPRIDVLRVTGAEVRSTLGMGGEAAVVVRPDGVVSWAGPLGGGALGSWLAARYPHA